MKYLEARRRVEDVATNDNGQEIPFQEGVNEHSQIPASRADEVIREAQKDDDDDPYKGIGY